MIIRPASHLDGIHILALFRSDKSIWPSGGKQIWWHYWASPSRTEEWHVADISGQVVGFIHWARTLDNTRNLYDLAVHPNYRGQGIGRALVEYLGTPVRCKTDHGSRAELFYKALGFVETKTEPTKTGTKLVTTYELERKMQAAVSGPWIMTFTGRRVNPLDLKPEDIDVADIAHALATVNRFAGHSIKPISVAQHSVYVSRLCEFMNDDLAWEALFHDGSEAYLGDMTRHLKMSSGMEGFRVAEQAAQRTINLAMGIMWSPQSSVPRLETSDEVGAADKLMARFEARKAFGRAWQPFDGYPDCTPEEEALVGRWAPWNWRKAEEAFHVQFRRLDGHARLAAAQTFRVESTGGLGAVEAAL